MREGWCYKKLGEVCSINSGKSIKSNLISTDIFEGGFPCYGGNGLRGYVPCNSHEGGLPVIGRVGALCGNVHYVQQPFYATEHALVVSKISEDVDHVWLCRLLESMKLGDYAEGVAQPVIAASKIAKLCISIPPLTTQQQIVSELDLLSHILDQKRQQLKEYDALAESIFYDMFGDPVENPKGWEVKTISEIVRKDKNSIKRGPFGGALKKEIFVESGYLVYEQYHALNNDYSYERYYITEEKFQEMKDFSVKGGDIIISCSGVNLGRLSIIPENCKPGIINQALLKLSLDNTLYSSSFFAYVFSSASFKEKYFGYNRGCAIPNLPPMSEFKRIKFVNPPLTLQRSFAAKIESIEHQKQLLRASIKETEMLFQSRMDYWFNS